MSEETSSLKGRSILRGLLIGSILGALVMAGVAFYGDATSLERLGRGYPWEFFGGACLLALLNYVMRWARWEIYLRTLGIALPIFRSVLIFVAGFAMSITPGKMGELLKAVLIRRDFGIEVATTAPIVVAERITDFLALLLLMCGGALYFPGAAPLAALAIPGALALLLLSQERTGRTMISWIAKLPIGKTLACRAEPLFESFWKLGTPRVFAAALGMSLVGWAMEVFAFQVVAQGLSHQLSFGDASFVFGASTLGGALSLLPAGLGPTEVGFAALLGQLGVGSDQAAFITILTRMATLWLAVALGIAALAVLGLTRLRSRDGIGLGK